MRLSLVVVGAVVLLGCVEPLPLPPVCGPDTCSGCCDAAGLCRDGDEVTACGVQGGACATCTSTQTCTSTGCEAQAVSCDGFEDVDFGLVARGFPVTQRFTYSNNSTAPRTLNIAVSGADYSATPSGSVEVAAGASQTIDITFAATQVGASEGSLQVSSTGACPTVEAMLRAEVVDNILVVEPPNLNFGYVGPTTTRNLALTVKNLGDVAVALSMFRVNGSRFTIVGTPPSSVPPRSSVDVTVAFTPTTLGATTGLLSFATDLSAQPAVSVPLSGSGGGPILFVGDMVTLPSVAVGGEVKGAVEVRNVGTRPNPPDDAANLFFETPAFVVTTLANTSLDEVLVELPAGYDPSTGVIASSTAMLDVTFRPTSAGPKSISLVIHTNAGSKTVIVSTEAIATVACAYTVSPTSIDFGVARPGITLDWPVVVTNTGTTPCAFLSAVISSGSATFAVENFTAGTVAPGASTSFAVRYTPPTSPPGSVTGSLVLVSNSMSQPSVVMPLEATVVSNNCILTPAYVDFGTAPANCRSATFNIPVINTCGTPVTISDAVLSNSTEFTLSASTGGSVPATGQLDFSARYQPADIGADRAMVSFTSTQAGVTLRHVIPLRGVGNSTALTTETFTIQARPSTDMLLVIDNSCSMADKQLSLANAGQALFQFATTGNFNFRFGAMSADSMGQLRGTSVGVPFVDALTPNAATEFASLVNVGTSGTSHACLEPATLALSDTALALSQRNAGLFRSDSHLGVLCFTDAADQSPNPVSFYLGRLAMVRGPQRPDAFSYSVVGPFLPLAPSGCSYDGSNTPVHEAAIAQFNGVKEEICSGNAGASAANVLSELLRRRSTTFSLLRPVDASTALTVSIRGSPVSTGWTHDAVSNRIVFDGLIAPSGGDTVTISYAPMCF